MGNSPCHFNLDPQMKQMKGPIREKPLDENILCCHKAISQSTNEYDLLLVIPRLKCNLYNRGHD